MGYYGFNYNTTYDPNAAAWQNYWAQYYQNMNNQNMYYTQPQAGMWPATGSTSNGNNFAPPANTWTPQPDAFTPQTQQTSPTMTDPAGGAMNLQDLISQMKQQQASSPEAAMPPVAPPKKKGSKIFGLLKYAAVVAIGYFIGKLTGKKSDEGENAQNDQAVIEASTKKHVKGSGENVYVVYPDDNTTKDDKFEPTDYFKITEGKAVKVKPDELEDISTQSESTEIKEEK